MKNFNSEKGMAIFFLGLSFLSFIAFGLYHISKFETVDEHFWKYDRTPQYWKAIKNHEWKKTYINDKPGITVALISGMGLPFSPDPTKHRLKDPENTRDNQLTKYNLADTEKINFALRLPILIFNGLFLIFFFWITYKMTDSWPIASLTVSFMALSPILVGISQIMNPDSLLWVFTGAAFFSYFALLKHNQKKFLFLTGTFTGLSLLSKYTANILFPAYLFIIFANYFVNFEKIEKEKTTTKYFIREILNFFIILIVSVAIFSLFLPSVFIKIKHLYNGILGFKELRPLLLPILLGILALSVDVLLWKSRLVREVGNFLNKHQQKLFKLVGLLGFLIFFVILINSWNNQTWIPFDNLRTEAYFEKQMTWGGLLDQDPFLIKITKEFLVEVYPLVFSLLPLSLFLVLFLWLKTACRGLYNFKLYVFFITFFIIIYFSANLKAGVLTNIRYSIMLYPLLALLSALSMHSIGETRFIKRFDSKKIFFSFYSIILLAGLLALWNSKPFYFNYTSSLLSKKFIITDAWGYGEYEAAEYLNSLPNSEKLIVWSDRSALCQFIKGACIRDYKIDLTKVIPDYFIISRRGTIRHHFAWRYPELAKKDNLSYYTNDLKNDYVWHLYIHDRPENFVKIIKSEEK